MQGFCDHQYNSLTLDHSRLLSNIALKKGCDFEDSRPHNDLYPNVLFVALGDRHRIYGRDVNSINTIDALLDYGCCIEQKNCNGMTPFLFAASVFRQRGTAKRIRALLRRRANPYEVDKHGRGALHIVFWSTKNNQWNIDCLELDNLPTQASSFLHYHLCGDLDALHKDCDDLTSAFYEDLETMHMGADQSDARDLCGDDHAVSANNENDGSDSYGSDAESCNRRNDCYCRDCMPGKRAMLHRIFQLRLRLVLFELLQAGCDPNLLDFDDKSPSQYAKHDKLWRHWTWALKHTGYVYEESSDAWVKPSQFDNMLEEMAMAPSSTAELDSGLGTYG